MPKAAMNRRRVLLALALAVAGGVIVAVWPVSQRTLIERLDSTDTQVQWEAMLDLAYSADLATRSSLVPKIVALLQSANPTVRHNAALQMRRFDPEGRFASRLAELLDDADESVRAAAARSLGDMGPGSDAHAPDLARLLNDPAHAVRWDALRSLQRMGPGVASPFAPQIAALLTDPNDEVRVAARNALASLGPAGSKPLDAQR